VLIIHKKRRRERMKKRVISIILAAAMTAGLMAGCGSSSSDGSASGSTEGSAAESTQSEAAGDTTAQLSAEDYNFEKEYMYGDFNAHSNNDTERQGGIDTFEDTDIAYEIINYGQLLDILNSDGYYLIQFSGSWCHNTRSLSPSVNKFAKEYGVDTIYMYDFDFDNKEDGNTFIRMSNGVENVGSNYNYFYGEVVSQYLTNLNDWVEYPSETEAAITYTNADGKDVTIARLQEPYLFLYNKDNTVDNSDSGNGSTSCPIVYAFEEMTDRDADGVYIKEYDEEGNEVTDDDGNPIKTYITEEFEGRLQKLFDYIKDNDIELEAYDKNSYIRNEYDALKDADQINIHSVSYCQLLWLFEQDGNSIVMFGNPDDETTQSTIGAINDKAVAEGVQVYLCDNRMDCGITSSEWNYSGRESVDFLDLEGMIGFMGTELVENYLTNIADTDLQAGYLFAYNKAAVDSDGFAAPVAASSTDESGIDAVFQAYADNSAK
jgi:thiol-disulfide isomerase/thioredoxin